MLTTEQQLQRARGVGSSEIASIAGENPFGNAHSVWLAKRGLTESQDTLQTWLGHELEPVLAKRYTMELGVELRRDQQTYECPEPLCPEIENEFGPGFMVATPDYRHANDDSVIVECKTVSGRVDHHWSPDEADGAPPYVLLQAQQQMGVIGAKRCDVAVLLLGFETRFLVYQIAFDPQLFGAIRTIAAKFWRQVANNEAPPVDGSDEARAVLREVYKLRLPDLKETTPESVAFFEEYAAATAAEKAAKKRKALAANQLIEAIGSHDGMIGNGYKATYLENVNGVWTLRVTEIGKKRKAA